LIEDEEKKIEKWSNWQLKFVHNQLFDLINNPNRFCPVAHHMTFVRYENPNNYLNNIKTHSLLHFISYLGKQRGETLMQ
jgi:hypothetical protein